MSQSAGFSSEELRAERPTAALAKTSYEGMTMAVSPDEAKRRLQQLQAFVASTMVANLDYGVIPGTDKPSLYQPGAQKLAEIYGFAHSFEPIETVKDWERGFFYFEYRCVLRTRRDGTLICEGIGSCNSRESKYAGRWVFGNDVPAGVDKTKLKKRSGTSKKGKPYEMFLVPNDDPYSLVNTIQKMAAKRAYVHAVISATRSAGIFTQDVEDLPLAAFSADPQPHDPETGEVREQAAAPAPSTAGEFEAHRHRLETANTLAELQAAGTLVARAGKARRITPAQTDELRAVAQRRRAAIVARQRGEGEPQSPPATDADPLRGEPADSPPPDDYPDGDPDRGP